MAGEAEATAQVLGRLRLASPQRFPECSLECCAGQSRRRPGSLNPCKCVSPLTDSNRRPLPTMEGVARRHPPDVFEYARGGPRQWLKLLTTWTRMVEPIGDRGPSGGLTDAC